VDADFAAPDGVTVLLDGLAAGLRARGRDTGLDVLVNNAAAPGGLPWRQTTREQFDRLVAVNARAPFLLLRDAVELIRDGGRVVNVSTGLTRCAEPGPEPIELAHSMSKAALEMLTLHLARVLGPRGITINTVAPGVVDTGAPGLDAPGVREFLSGLSVFGRIGRPEDVADLIARLVAEDARWVTGSWIDVTGGALV
jgi:3-oxoacyl-[acyl-carrier protein] reductase